MTEKTKNALEAVEAHHLCLFQVPTLGLNLLLERFFTGRTPPVSSAPDSVARKKRHQADTPPVLVPACQRGTGVVRSKEVGQDS